MLNRRHFLGLCTLALAATACTPQASTPVATEKVTIGLTYIPNVQFSPFYVAEDEKLFASRGLNATLRHHGTQEGLFDALLAGTEHIVVAGADEAMQARSRGADLITVGSYYRQFPVTVIARSDTQIRTLADLRGHHIGVPGRYGSTWYGLLVALSNAGLTEADVTITEIGYTAQAALSTNKVDAVVGYSNNDAVAIKLAGIDITEVSLGDQIPMVGTSIITTQAFAKAHPEVVKSVVAVTCESIKKIVADSEKAITATAARVPGMDDRTMEAARATVKATIPFWAPQGEVSAVLDVDKFAAMEAFMTKNGLITATAGGATAATNEYSG
ncbi:MAG: ABC transporter substrate-binding protein [Propionibacteriaceae bacterium]